jgi:hypothetical protein
MTEILKIGKALYEVDYETKTYWFYGRNEEKVSKPKRCINLVS